MVAVILVDSNVWIFAAQADAPEHGLALRRLSVMLPNNDVAINAIIVSEVFHKIAVMHGVAEAERKTRVMLDHPLVEWLELSKETAAEAVKLAAQTGLRINDALIAQQAIKAGIPVLTDNAKDFVKVKGLKVAPLR